MQSTEPLTQSYLGWMFSALGFPYVILLAMSGLFSFLLALVLVLRGRGPMAVASLVLLVHLPLLIGVLIALQGAVASFSIIATAAVAPKPAEVAAGISTALFGPLVGILLMLPGYAVAAVGSFVRAFQPENAAAASLAGGAGCS